MTVKEKRKAINREVYKYLDDNGFTYEYEDGGRVSIWKDDVVDSFDYHLSRHDVCCLNWSSDEIKDEVEKLEEFIKDTIRIFEWKFEGKDQDGEVVSLNN